MNTPEYKILKAEHEALKVKFNNLHKQYEEIQVSNSDEKKKLEERLEIAEKKRAKAEETCRELKFKNEKLIKDRREIKSENQNLKKRAEDGERIVKIKKEAAEKFQENMMKREEKLSKERRNFNAEQRKLNEKIKATLLEWTSTGAISSNERSGLGRTDSSNTAPSTGSNAARRATINPSVPVSRPTVQNDNETLPPLVEVKQEIKSEPVRDPDFGPNPLRTRPILDRGAKRRYSDIIILD